MTTGIALTANMQKSNTDKNQDVLVDNINF